MRGWLSSAIPSFFVTGVLQPGVLPSAEAYPLYGMSSVRFLIFDGLWREITARVGRFVRSVSGRSAEKRRNLARSKMRGFLRFERSIVGFHSDRVAALQVGNSTAVNSL